MKKKIIYGSFILFTFIFCFLLVHFSYPNVDYVWNYGFSFNVSQNLIMYKDFSMVIPPLYPFVIGNLMKVFGNTPFVFNFINAMIVFVFFLFLFKKKRNIYLPLWIIFAFILFPSYNLWCIFYLFLLYILEEENKNDYFIGVVLGLLCLTKTSFIILIFASFYFYKKPLKIVKRCIGFFIPVFFFLIYFIFTGSLFDFFNCVFGGLFDFGSKNGYFTYLMIIPLLICIYLIYRFIKTKDVKVLYVLLFQIMSYPLFNFRHIYYSCIPFIFYILDTHSIKIHQYIEIILFPLLFMPFVQTVVTFKENLEVGDGRFQNMYVIKEYKNNALAIKEHVNDLNDVILVVEEAYYYKFLWNMNVGKYDLLLNGNNGYHSISKLIEEIDAMPLNKQFVLYREMPRGQVIQEVDAYIRNQCYLVKTFGNLELYQKK